MSAKKQQLYSDFFQFIQNKQLFVPNQHRILLAVSGGVDSMVMLHLFQQANFEFAVAHCNFQLRGEEANSDQHFVKDYCATTNTPFHTICFDTKKHAQTQGISIQMAARELRYNWFEQLTKQHQYNYIATAHHKGDVVETFFINLARGTGIRGLSGIDIKTEGVIRPLLFASRKQILKYAQQNKIAFREDSSNASVKYIRNKIRHDILPTFEGMFHNYSDTVLSNIERLKGIEEVYLEAIQTKKEQAVSETQEKTEIDISKLKKLSPLPTYLYEFLRPFSFNSDMVNDICKVLNKHSGKQFFSPTHRLIKDRDKLIIVPISQQESNTEIMINSDASDVYVHENKRDALGLSISKFSASHFELKRDINIAAFDVNLVKFPLTLRKWKQGDSFQPLGMKGKKKVSDFFSDNKFTLLQKEDTWLLTSQGNVIWVVGWRIDERYKVSEDTEHVVQVQKVI